MPKYLVSSFRASDEGNSQNSQPKRTGSVIDCYVNRTDIDYRAGNEWTCCKSCGRKFRADFRGQKFCDKECYYTSLRGNIVDRFWSKVSRGEPDACWMWQGFCHRDGHGMLAGTVNGKRRPVYAHRVSWELANGPIPDGLVVCHTCDVPTCVNPAHLFLGSQADNLADARRKGRLVDGRGARKLSDAAYLEILTSKLSGVDLAAKHGVSKVTISRIRNGRQGSTFHRDPIGLNNVEPVPSVQVPVRGEVS